MDNMYRNSEGCVAVREGTWRDFIILKRRRMLQTYEKKVKVGSLGAREEWSPDWVDK